MLANEAEDDDCQVLLEIAFLSDERERDIRVDESTLPPLPYYLWILS